MGVRLQTVQVSFQFHPYFRTFYSCNSIMGNKICLGIFFIVAAFILIPRGEAINCYVCESYNATRNASIPLADQADLHANCPSDPFNSTGVPLVTCDVSFNACFKVITKRYELDNFKNNRNLAHTYVTRLCASRTAEELASGSSKCEGESNADTDTVSCYCNDGDGCNGATGIEGHAPLFILSVIFALCIRLFC